jgi:SAM-dependent methyltransferase
MKLAKVFDNAKLYEVFQFALAKKTFHKIIKNEILKPDDGISSVLDFGCGIGFHSKFFPSAEYLGIEPLASCIAIANKNYADSSTQFILGDNSHLKNLNNESYDLVIALGVLHHIDDETFNEFIRETYRILKPGGRLTTLDPVFHPRQTKISEWIVKRDRGAWVRTELEYMGPVEKFFSGKIETKIYSNLNRIPYDHFAMSVTKS